ncbi:MAG: orotidine-5'-phosphate decarboxylase [bacterium]|nr:orotidine-5'-phosphate decarboxylase [bacterium]
MTSQEKSKRRRKGEMEAKDRIIVALDVDRLEKALELVNEIHNYCGYFKVGLELLTSEGAPRVISAIQKAGGKIFFDGKFKDIPNTVAAASRAVTKLGVDMFNVHCLGGEAMMKAAVKVAEEISEIQRRRRPIILGVTLLTSLDYSDLVEMGIYDELNIADPEELAQIKKERIERLVIKLVLLAQESGLDGVICSPQEIRIIRQWCQPEFLIATPDVRPVWAAIGDQKRVMTPGEAILAGADYLVIDRPITQPPAEIGGPVAAAKAIIKEITDALKIKDVPPEIMHDDIINA